MAPFYLGGGSIDTIFTPLLALCIALNFNGLLLSPSLIVLLVMEMGEEYKDEWEACAF